jgi:putative NIF3 family GTP cyclohydrolase 1 type 2
MKNSEVIEKILAYHPDMPNYKGCDEYKIGNPEEECKGVALSLVPTVEVIRKMIEKGCNLLITHEPIFYQTPDYPEWEGSFPNSIYEEKRQLLLDHHITVWRDHDHIHMHQPDGIFTGVLKYLGWETYYQPNPENPFCFEVRLPETTVGDLGAYLIEKLHLNGLRYMGNPTDKISKVALVGHLFPNAFYQDGLDENGHYQDYAMKLMEQMEKEDGIEAIIPGEIIEWTVLSYIRDAIAMGKGKACYNIGHFNMEELGMRYAKDWVEELVEGKLPVHYIPTEDAFSYT